MYDHSVSSRNEPQKFKSIKLEHKINFLERPLSREIENEKHAMSYSHSARKLTVELFDKRLAPDHLKHQKRLEKAV